MARRPSIIDLSVMKDFKSDAKQRFIQKIDSIVSQPCSVYGYQFDIQGAMDEMFITLEDYLKMCLNSLCRQVKTPDEIKMLYGYMFFMKGLTTMLLKIEKKTFHETLHTLASHIGHEHHDKDKVLFRLGDKGRKAYIILKGSVSVIIGKQMQMRVYIRNYIQYLGNLLRYKEYGLVNKVLNDNFQTFPIEIIQKDSDDNAEKEVIEEEKTVNKKTKKDLLILTEEERKMIKLNQRNQLLKASMESKVKKYTLEELITEYGDDDDNIIKGQNTINNISADDYVKRMNILNGLPDKLYNNEIINIKVYIYVNIISSATGSLFGDIALSDPQALRTATIITNTECHFGTLNKNSYNISLKTGAEKQRRQNINFILSLEIFSNIPQSIFQKKHFNNFTLNNCEKGFFLLNEGDTPNNIYLLKEGSFEVTLRVSLNELTQLLKFLYRKQTDSSLAIAELENNERQAFHKISENWKFGKLYYEKTTIRVAEMSPPEIAGLGDFIGEKGLIVFSVECKSPKGEYYQINHDLYNEMASKDVSMQNNEESFLRKKISFLCKRLSIIRKSTIQSFFDYKDTFEKLHIEKEMNDEYAKVILMKRMFEFKKKIETTKDLRLKTSSTFLRPPINITDNNENNITGNESVRVMKNKPTQLNPLSPYSFHKPKKILSNLLLSTEYTHINTNTTTKPKDDRRYNKRHILKLLSRNEGRSITKKSMNGRIEITRESNYFTKQNLSVDFRCQTSGNRDITPIEVFHKPTLPVTGVHLTAMVWENVHQKSLMPICKTETQIMPVQSSSPNQSYSNHSRYQDSSVQTKTKTHIIIKGKSLKEKRRKHYNKSTIFLMRESTKAKELIDIGKYTQMKHENYLENRNKYLVKDYNRVNLKIQGGKYK